MHAWYAWTSSIHAHVRAAAKDNNNNERCAACKTSRPDPCLKFSFLMRCKLSLGEQKVGRSRCKPMSSIF